LCTVATDAFGFISNSPYNTRLRGGSGARNETSNNSSPHSL
jgi:hypothetical protein